MSEKMFKAGQALSKAYKKIDDFANKGLITTLKQRFKGKTPISTGNVLSKSKELVKFDPKKALPATLPKAAKKLGKLGKVARIARAATPLALGFEAANLAYKVATLSPEKKAKVKKLKTKLSKVSTKDYHADLMKMSTGGDTMLKNPKKADLDKDGKLSSYEKKRGKAIESNMMKARVGKSIETAGSKKAKYEDERKTLLKKLRGAQIGPVEEARLSEKGNQAMRDALREKKMMKASLGALALGAVGAKAAKKLMKKKASAVSPAMDFLGDAAKKSMGGEMKGYGAARTSGMGLQDEQLVPGKSLDYYKDLM